VSAPLKAPFPFFGGKSRVAAGVWDHFGNVQNYVEPFAGSLAVLLGRPHEPSIETVNDKDCYLANFWRAVAWDPKAVAHHADWPVNEADLHARHQWLVDQKDFQEKMKTDPRYFDPQIAGWWVWGISQWIGSGWCEHPEWTGRTNAGSAARGIHRKRPHLAHAGKGVHRKLPDISGHGGAVGRGVFAEYARTDLLAYMTALSDRLRNVRVCCGDWTRVLGPSPTTRIGLTGVFLDPPYAVADRDAVYVEDSRDLAHDVCRWAIEHGDDPLMRIAVCGYEGEHAFPASWECVAWKAHGGYSGQAEAADSQGKQNKHRERIWFSPYCLTAGLFGL
jgi:DNA adenine methylase